MLPRNAAAKPWYSAVTLQPLSANLPHLAISARQVNLESRDSLKCFYKHDRCERQAKASGSVLTRQQASFAHACSEDSLVRRNLAGCGRPGTPACANDSSWCGS